MQNIEKIKTIYKDALAENGDTSASVCWPKGRQHKRFANLLEPMLDMYDGQLSLCDFGCGLAHMQQYLIQNKIEKFSYTGLDIVPEMVAKANSLGRNAKLISHDSVLNEQYDCIVASGVFNIKYFDCDRLNQKYIFERLSVLLASCKYYFACDFMRPDVDFVQAGAWHQSYDSLLSFISKFSRDSQLDMRPLPYEYTVRVYLNA